MAKRVVAPGLLYYALAHGHFSRVLRKHGSVLGLEACTMASPRSQRFDVQDLDVYGLR